MQSARLNWTNALAQQTVSMVADAGHHLYCERAIAFAISAMTGDKVKWPTLLNLFDLVVTVERNMFKKSLVLNGLVNFCICNGDGFTVQHQLLNRVLEVLIEKYY
ncbi:unknown [Choristoneura fumiferana multiple nucleopolyhedrovirus]|uniref:Uncharacterized protein n=1 Tax=Choristoneura fumiferana nuclear polyhedrosis virus TaxID=208973 RepID=Q9YP19_NPVCF|nr:unknown [Choristoneura fumiferana multiple nucleopolyhedrovirus]AAD10304.1 unknown [Choristoneura fumiferana multiple nucleopolyhedrovirus]AAD28250.1 unknown [Choristoneura fumiferana multiple nucleopolyhedrovirus]AGR57021.1 hypothetical protein [Choristoneura occidentalis alphabaculovirus]